MKYPTQKEELNIYRNLLITLHTYRWTGNSKKVNEILDLIGAYSYVRTNSSEGAEKQEKRARKNTLLNLKNV